MRITDIKVETIMEIVTKDKTHRDQVCLEENEDLKSFFARVKSSYLSLIREVRIEP